MAMSKPKYDHHAIEKRWEDLWIKSRAFAAKLEDKPKKYILDMFPYPSGSGLHVGHVTGYTSSDILSRYYRKKGFNVLHPMGWDSFGLPAEQYAIRTGVHPAVTTQDNINNFRRQLQRMGFGYDWDREIATSDPKYYRWTQWIFGLLYKKGLAYEAELLVNYCPMLGTVVANEEVENGRTREGGYPVERRLLRQWVLKITAYAERLSADLEQVDWPENVKELQRNWIGRSQGAKVYFHEAKTQELITVFTTRPDTIYGVSYLVLSPEHPLVEKITSQQQKELVQAYQKEIASKSDLERTELNKAKTGVFTGAHAIHPITKIQIPIYIADYVLPGYGTGAVMGVPAHDSRDFEFATKYTLPIFPVILPADSQDVDLYKRISQGLECYEGEGVAINSDELDGLSTYAAKEAAIRILQENGAGESCITYKLRDWLFSRQRYWGEPFPILHFEDGSKRVLDLDELPLIPPDINNYLPSETGESPLARSKEWVEITDPKSGKPSRRETNTMPQWAGSCWYYLRFADPHNTREAWGKDEEQYWLPVDIYIGGVEHAVLHLLYARFWHKVLFDLGLVSSSEPFKQYRYQGIVTARSYQKSGGGYVAPEDVIEKEGGYYQRDTGESLRSQVEKMSKSKLNGVSPDEIIEESGADALRLYAAFMGPFDREKVWNTDAVTGCRRFLARLFDLAHSPRLTDERDSGDAKKGMTLAHRLLHVVTKDIEQLQFNTAIAKMMEFLNEFSSLEHYPKEAVKILLHLLVAFAPHLAHELWQKLEFTGALDEELYPEVDQAALYDSTATYIVQINGKVRAKIELPTGLPEEELMKIATSHPNVVKHLPTSPKSHVFVPNRLINFVL
jgi:leucyl-tRNA synthetase